MKFKKLNESSLVDKKVSTLGKRGKPMYFTAAQLKDAKAKYPEYDFEETTTEYSLPQGQKAYIAKKRANESKSIKVFGAKAKKLNEVVYTGKKMKDKSRIKKELEDKIYNAFIKLALSPTWGYDDKKEVEFYIMPKVEVSDYTENDFDFKVEFRAELSYSELVEACETLDKIVMKYDENAYFEPVQPGIADAFITLPKDLNESVREYTNKLLDMVDEGIVDKDILIRELLNYMSEDEVKDFVITNEYDD